VTVDDNSRIDDVTAASDVKPVYRRRADAIGRWIRPGVARWRPILVTLMLIAATGLAACVYFLEYRPDQRTDDATAHQVITAASEGAVALLSYSSDNLGRDFANAKSRLTDDFQDYYKRFTEQIVVPTAQRGLTTSARVVRAAVSELHPNTAVVLVFVNQKTTSKDKPEPVTTGRSVQVKLTKVNGSWLISQFDAV
jgi:Mce-associated membrane protein